jgi:hypothetical protein
MKRTFAAALAAASIACAHAQHMPDVPQLMATQREAMKPLKAMDGVWRGPAWTLRPDGSRHELTQTERIGPFVEGTVKVLEGRGYEKDGSVAFNAFGVVYWDAQKKAYGMRSWALGRTGDFKFEPLADGYAWEVQFPGGMVRYVGTITGNKLREVGHTTIQGRPPVQTFEMNLERVGDTDWPLGTPVPMK